MTYHRSMMPGQQWVTVRKCNCEGGLYRKTMSGVGPIMPMQQSPALVNRAKQVVSALTGFGRG